MVGVKMKNTFRNVLGQSCSLRALAAGALSAGFLAGCATVDPVPEVTRLAALRAEPVDYSRFPGRAEEDAALAAGGRGIRGSVQLAQESKGYALLGDVAIEEDLLAILGTVLPTDYSYQIGDQVLQEYPLETQVHVVDAPEGDDFARALPNGDIVFADELLLDLTYRDTLEWIVAHEAAHQLLDHHRVEENLERRAKIFSALATVAILVDGSRNDGQAGLISQLALGATAAVVGVDAANTAQFKADQELEADQLAMDLVLNKADPRNPNAGLDYLQANVDTAEQVLAGRQAALDAQVQRLTSLCGEVPSFGERLLGDLFILQRAEGNPNATTRECQIWYAAGPDGYKSTYGIDEAQNNLDAYQQRLSASREYYALHIATLDRDPPAYVEFINAEGERTSYPKLVSATGPLIRNKQVEQARKFLAQSPPACTQALFEARSAILGPTEAEPKIRRVNYDVEKACTAEALPYETNPTCLPDGPHLGALEHLCILYEAERGAADDYAILSQELEAAGYYAKALDVMTAQRGLLPDRWNFFYPQEIRLQRLQGNEDGRRDALAACRELGDGWEIIKSECETEAKPPEPEDVDADGAVGAPFGTPTGNSVLDQPTGSGPAVDAPPADVPVSVNQSPVQISQVAADEIAEVIATLPSFSVFKEALWRTELNQLIRGSGNFTVYMPSDAALRDYVGGDPEVLLAPRNRAKLRALIANHIAFTPERDGKNVSSRPSIMVGRDGDDLDALLVRAGGEAYGDGLQVKNGRVRGINVVLTPDLNDGGNGLK